MNPLKIVYAFCFLLIPFTVLIGQRCFIDQGFYDQQVREELEILSKTFNKKPIAAVRSKIEIPVVVHIVWHTEEENLSEEQIQSQLEVLNRDFQLLNTDTSLVPDLFKAIIGNPQLVFKLAETDPDGNPSTGITRTETRYENIGFPSITAPAPLYYTEAGGKDAWDTKRYLNIWVADMPREGEGGIGIGYASRPGQRIPEEDGIIIDYRHFGTTGTVQEPYHLGRTLVHEVGHYFNLLHINGNDTMDCNKDDMVEDTPFQTNNYLECQWELVSTCESEDLTVNFMNLVDDECMVMFTKGQVERMMAALTIARSELFNPSVSIKNVDQTNNSKLVITPNPARHTITLKVVKDIEKVPYQLINYQGQQILEGELVQTLTPLDISALSRGVYLVILHFEEGPIVTKLLLH